MNSSKDFHEIRYWGVLLKSVETFQLSQNRTTTWVFSRTGVGQDNGNTQILYIFLF
jgi:hypothetical protein